MTDTNTPKIAPKIQKKELVSRKKNNIKPEDKNSILLNNLNENHKTNNDKDNLHNSDIHTSEHTVEILDNFAENKNSNNIIEQENDNSNMNDEVVEIND